MLAGVRRVLPMPPIAAATARVDPRIRIRAVVAHRIPGPDILIVQPARIGGPVTPLPIGVGVPMARPVQRCRSIQVGHTRDGRCADGLGRKGNGKRW